MWASKFPYLDVSVIEMLVIQIPTEMELVKSWKKNDFYSRKLLRKIVFIEKDVISIESKVRIKNMVQ